MSHATQLHHRRYLDDSVEMINRTGLPGNVTVEVCQHVQETVVAAVHSAIEQALEEELLRYLGGERSAHLPWGRCPEQTRSGTSGRTLFTQDGGIAHLRVPTLRRGHRALPWHTITRYERCWGPLLDQQMLGDCVGLSRRDLQETMRWTRGEVLSLEACTRVVWQREAPVRTAKSTRLSAPPPIIMVDGMWVTIASPTGDVTVDAQGRTRAAKRTQHRVGLSALGVWPDGHWEMVSWQGAEQEHVEAWDAFFAHLSRGRRRPLPSRTTAFTYDTNNRLVTKRFADGTQVSFTYTPTGKVQTATDEHGTTTSSYDVRDRLLTVVHPAGSTIAYTYDAAGNRTSVTTPSGTTPSGTTISTYDALQRWRTVTDSGGLVMTYTYDAVGNRASLTYLNGTMAEYTYDTVHRLIALVHLHADASVLASYDYTLGPVGNRTRVVEDTGRRVDYTYDALLRLVEERITGPVAGNETISYTYDVVGNRLTRTASGGTITSTYDANDRLLTAGSIIYAYDDNGNTVRQTASGALTTYACDGADRLIAAQHAGVLITYAYDAEGIRTRVTVNGLVTTYLVDKYRDFAQVLEESDGTGGLRVRYVYGDDLISQGGASVDRPPAMSQ